MIKANFNDKERLVAYLLKESSMNIFLISDIENYGFDSKIQDVWFTLNKDQEINGVLLRYHTVLIVYSHDLSMPFEAVNEIIATYDILTISGKQEVIDHIKPILSENKQYREVSQNMAVCKNDYQLVDVDGLTTATVDDALDIAQSYQEIDEFRGLYSSDVNQLVAQIVSRIENGEGKHVFIKDEFGIVAHANTTAENKYQAMIGGLFVREDKRKQGYSRKILEYLIADIQARNKEAVLIYEHDLEKFYAQFGFVKEGQWCSLGRI